MKLDEDIRRCVVFLGYADDTPSMGGIWCVGTGFLLHYKGCAYLVTAKHIANALGDSSFIIRVNDKKRNAANLNVNQIKWILHEDENVDLAISELWLPTNKSDSLYIRDELISPIGEKNIGIGDMTYTIGLFRLMSGITRNLPVVHVGNIAMVPSDEKIPVKDWDDPNPTSNRRKYVEGYLIESQSLDGLSGSPVFARPVLEFPFGRNDDAGILGSIVPQKNIHLIGVWQGAWNAPPDDVLSAEIEQGKRVRVSLGMGVVIPITKLIELLEKPELQKRRGEINAEREARVYAAEPESAKRHSNQENPQHKEDFNSLLTAAVKKKKPVDET